MINGEVVRELALPSSLGLYLGKTGFTEKGVPKIDPLHCVRRSHGTAVVLAMAEIKGVTKFMNAFFEQTLAQQCVVGLEPVKLLAQAVIGNESAWAPHLRFSEHVFQNGDVQVDLGDGKQAPLFRPYEFAHSTEDLGRMILLPLRVVTRSGIEIQLQYLACNRKIARDGGTQIFEKRSIRFTNRKQVNQIHGGSSRSDEAPVPAVTFQLMVKCNPINAENVCRPALVVAALLENTENVGPLDLIQ